MGDILTFDSKVKDVAVKSKKEETVSDKERKKNLDNALAAIEKNFGKGSIMKMTGDIQDYPHIPTGIISLDTALGIGGLPRGRIVEIFGPESSGKTTLTLHVIAEAQKAGGLAAFVDAEHALDPMYATNLDVDIPNLLIAQPDSGEDALEITEHLIRSNSLDVIVIDSVAALTPKAEIEGDMGQSHMGLQARLMSQAMRKLTAAIHKTGTLVIFINQLRQKIGVTWGSNETTTGGNALKFYCSVRLDIRRIGTTKKTINGVETPWTNQTRIKVAKNKVAPPFRQTEVDMMIGGQGFGVDKIGDLIDLAVKAGFVKKTGTWYSKGETKLGQGKANAVQFFNDNEDQLIALEKEVRGSIKKTNEVLAVGAPDEEVKDSEAEAPTETTEAEKSVDVKSDEVEAKTIEVKAEVSEATKPEAQKVDKKKTRKPSKK